MASGIGQPNESPAQGELAELGQIEDAFQQSLIVFRCPFLKLVFRNIWKGHIVTRIDDSDAKKKMRDVYKNYTKCESDNFRGKILSKAYFFGVKIIF